MIRFYKMYEPIIAIIAIAQITAFFFYLAVF